MEIVLALLVVILLVLVVIAVRTWQFSRTAAAASLPFPAQLPDPRLDPMLAAQHLSAAIQVQTVSHEDAAQDQPENFAVLHQLFRQEYPLLHQRLQCEELEGGSLLYTWSGKDPSLEPVLFMAHQDVVPADEHTLNKWTYPPFSGAIADGFIWGRGSMDIKCQLIAILDAVENLLSAGFQPLRTVFLAFSHDEEVLGFGARRIVARLQQQNIRLHAVLDEGTYVLEGVLPGFSGRTAPIAVTEKGYLSLKFSVESTGGHSSTPSSETAIGVLSRAIDRLQSNPFPYRLKVALPMFKAFSPAESTMMKVAFANLWLFGPMVRRQLAASSETAASIHTTTAPTIFHSGIKDNVLPSLAEAVVNFRILPGESVSSVCDRVRAVVNDDRVSFAPLPNNAWEPSPVSPSDCSAYQHLTTVVRDLFPDTTCAPNAMLGATDSRHYHAISDRVYRFTPILVHKEDLERIHGINERLSLENMNHLVLFFYRLIQRWSSQDQ
ncbi:MAG: M20 family peptidase [Anaerolineaceae bacterium]